MPLWGQFVDQIKRTIRASFDQQIGPIEASNKKWCVFLRHDGIYHAFFFTVVFVKKNCEGGNFDFSFFGF